MVREQLVRILVLGRRHLVAHAGPRVVKSLRAAATSRRAPSAVLLAITVDTERPASPAVPLDCQRSGSSLAPFSPWSGGRRRSREHRRRHRDTQVAAEWGEAAPHRAELWELCGDFARGLRPENGSAGRGHANDAYPADRLSLLSEIERRPNRESPSSATSSPATTPVTSPTVAAQKRHFFAARRRVGSPPPGTGGGGGAVRRVVAAAVSSMKVAATPGTSPSAGGAAELRVRTARSVPRRDDGRLASGRSGGNGCGVVGCARPPSGTSEALVFCHHLWGPHTRSARPCGNSDGVQSNPDSLQIWPSVKAYTGSARRRRPMAGAEESAATPTPDFPRKTDL